MIGALKRLFEDAVEQAASAGGADAEHGVQRAAAALLVEMSRADRTVTDGEREHIARALASVFGLPGAEVDELMTAGEAGADEATSLYEFTRVLNDHLDHDGKVRFVEQLWRVAFSDGELEKPEAHLVRKVADLLHLRHHEYIGARLRAEPGD